MAKSPDAFRTISEVADWLGVQAHVLRFWESKFAQVKPIKRAGGRRYYRPSDMLLLGGLKRVLHEDGMTIKGAQKLLREKGVGYVADMSQPLDDLTIAVIEGSSEPVAAEDALPDPGGTETASPPLQITEPEIAAEAEPMPDTVEPEPDDAPFEPQISPSETALEQEGTSENLHASADTEDDEEPAAAPAPPIDQQPDLPLEVTDEAQPEPEPQNAEPAPMISFRARPRDQLSEPPPEADETTADIDTPSKPETGPEQPAAPEPVEEPPGLVEATPKPQRVDVTLVHDHTIIEVNPSALSALSQIRSLNAEHASDIRPLLARLTRLRASMANPRKEQRKD